MEKILLSLKNIYRLFTIQDFPTYSEAILTEKNRRGLTLVKFWLTYLADDFRNNQYGKMIWRSEGKRNRHISTVINRSGVQSAYSNYEIECMEAINIQVLKHQQERFQCLLKEREFSVKAFLWKVREYLKRLDDDPYLNKETKNYLLECFHRIEKKCQDEEDVGYYSAWMLTLLTVFALTGAEMNCLPQKSCFARDIPGILEERGTFEDRKKVFDFLTRHTGELSRNPLPKQHFFGREQEVFEMRQMVMHGGRYLISGMGGIGKTELLRQILRIIIEEGLCDAVALISYENNIAMSFVSAFGEVSSSDLNVKYMEILGRINMLSDKKIIILIDNMNHEALKDTGLEALMNLPVTILATSRLRKIHGFTTFEIKHLSTDAGSLVFRDHYGKKMTAEGYEALSQILSVKSSRHPLTLRFLGRVAGTENCSVKDIKNQFMKDSGQIHMDNDHEFVFLSQIYQQVYQLNGLSYKDKCLLDIYSKLPYRSYPESFILEFFLDLDHNCNQVKRRLNTLCLLGFLEKSERGFSMHPFIAECLGHRKVERKEYFFDRLLESIIKYLDETVFVQPSSEGVLKRKEDTYVDASLQYLSGPMLMDVFAKSPKLGDNCHIFLEYEKNIKRQDLNLRQIGTILLAIEAVGRIYGFSSDMYHRLASLREEYKKMPFSWQVRCLIMEAGNEALCADDYEKIFDSYVKKLNQEVLSERLYEYFWLAYIKILRHAGKVDEVLLLCEEVYDKVKNPVLKVEVSKHIISMLIRKRSYSEISLWIEKSEQLLSPGMDVEMYREFLMQKGRYYFFTEQWEQFQKTQEEISRSIKEKDIRWQYEAFYWKGMAELKKNENEQAAISLKSARTYARGYFGKNHTTVAYVDQAIGVMSCNLEQYDEALFYTREAYEIFLHYPGEIFMRRALKNNIGYLMMMTGRIDEAIVCFNELFDELKEDKKNSDGEIMRQVSDNLAKIYHELSNEEKEKHWIRVSEELRRN